jgi:hypothetical protein
MAQGGTWHRLEHGRDSVGFNYGCLMLFKVFLDAVYI